MELRDGKIHREREYFDRLTMLEQLGVAPSSNEH
jgi:ketosteroid isomerase-like protein